LIKEAREKLGISQRELGERLGIPKRTIEHWESGDRKPPEWAETLLKERMEDMTMDLIIKRRHNADYDCEEYNCGKGWRTTLLGAMEEAGYPIKTQALTRYLQSVAIARGKDEYEAEKIAKQVEDFFGILEVPADLNPKHHA
jgi:transcriptional regulator with XRE-family HTH domain